MLFCCNLRGSFRDIDAWKLFNECDKMKTVVIPYMKVFPLITLWLGLRSSMKIFTTNFNGPLSPTVSQLSEGELALTPLALASQDLNLMLSDDRLPYTDAVTHQGLTRNLRNGSKTVQVRIDCTRRSPYLLIPVGLNWENGLPSTTSKKLIMTYLLPHLL